MRKSTIASSLYNTLMFENIRRKQQTFVRKFNENKPKTVQAKSHIL